MTRSMRRIPDRETVLEAYRVRKPPPDLTPKYIRDPKIESWHRLETLRKQRLGFCDRNIAKQYNVKRTISGRDLAEEDYITLMSAEKKPMSGYVSPKHFQRGTNSLTPFYSLYGMTYGYFFDKQADRKKRLIGIPPADLVSWRSNDGTW